MAELRGGRYTEPMKNHFLIIALSLFCVSHSSFAQWQWLDKDGHKVFSDRAPPPDIADKSILKRPSAAAKAAAQNEAAAEPSGVAPNLPASAPVRPPVSGVDKELEAKKKQAADAELAKRKATEESNAKARIENCARAKQAKANIESGVRISRTNANGDREVLDDAARATELKHIQSIMESECK